MYFAEGPVDLCRFNVRNSNESNRFRKFFREPHWIYCFWRIDRGSVVTDDTFSAIFFHATCFEPKQPILQWKIAKNERYRKCLKSVWKEYIYIFRPSKFLSNRNFIVGNAENSVYDTTDIGRFLHFFIIFLKSVEVRNASWYSTHLGSSLSTYFTNTMMMRFFCAVGSRLIQRKKTDDGYNPETANKIFSSHHSIHVNVSWIIVCCLQM